MPFDPIDAINMANKTLIRYLIDLSRDPKARPNELMHRWSKLLYPIPVHCFAISMVPYYPELRDPTQAISMVRSFWPPGVSQEFYEKAMPGRNFIHEAALTQTPVWWSTDSPNKDDAIRLFKRHGISSGYVLPSRIDDSYCVLIVGSEDMDVDIPEVIEPWLNMLDLCLLTTHNLILSRFHQTYTPYTFTLVKEHQVVFRLVIKGYTNEAIAEELGISKSAVVSRIHAAKERLREVNPANANDERLKSTAFVAHLFARAQLF